MMRFANDNFLGIRIFVCLSSHQPPTAVQADEEAGRHNAPESSDHSPEGDSASECNGTSTAILLLVPFSYVLLQAVEVEQHEEQVECSQSKTCSV